MKIAALLISVFFAASSLAAQEVGPAGFEVTIALLPGGVAGPMADEFTTTGILVPSPDSVDYLGFEFHLRAYPVSWFGVEGFADLGVASARAKGSKPLDLLNISNFNFGPVIRVLIPNSPRSNYNITLSGGPALSGLSWNSAFTGLTSSFILADLQTSTGYYLRGGFGFQDGNLIGRISIMGTTLPVRLTNGNDLSGTVISVPLEVGLAF